MTKPRRLLSGALLPLVLAGTLAGCGGDDAPSEGAKATPHDMAGMNHTPGPDEATKATSPGDAVAEPGSEGEKVDQAFVRQMTPHHLAAVMMATIAADRTKREKLKRFAARIVQAQTKELATLQRLGAPLGVSEGTSAGDDAMAKDLETLGVPASAMSMSMHTIDEKTPPFADVKDDDFDVAFLDAMLEHHQGALEMAKAEQERGSNQEIKDLAQQIERDQQAEIETMQAWKRHW